MVGAVQGLVATSFFFQVPSDLTQKSPPDCSNETNGGTTPPSVRARQQHHDWCMDSELAAGCSPEHPRVNGSVRTETSAGQAPIQSKEKRKTFAAAGKSPVLSLTFTLHLLAYATHPHSDTGPTYARTYLTRTAGRDRPSALLSSQPWRACSTGPLRIEVAFW